MRFLSFALVWLVVIFVLQITAVSEGYSEDLVPVPGCRFFSGDEATDSMEMTVVCSEFNINSTPDLLPNCTNSLKIYRTKNVPTNVALVPHLPMLSVLELTYNSLHNVSKVMFEGLEKLKSISLKRNFIKFVPPDVFVNNMNLEFVDLSNNFLLSVKSVVIAVGKLKNLKSLSLSDNKLIRWINDDDLIPLKNSSLEALDLSGCVIQYVESNAFQPLKFLASLNISMNPLPEEGLTNLSQSLNRFNLKDLSAYEMADTPYFSCRLLRWLQSSHLESLDISKNRFICFPKGNYPYLKSLTFNKCNIHQRYEDWFSGMPKLEFLVMQQHKLTGIDKDFKSNLRLKVLDLGDFVGDKSYTIFKIADFAFENQKELVDLRLPKLPIRMNIGRYLLYGLTNCRSVSFYDDSITSIDCFAFESLNNLTHLDLSYNSITELSNCTFYGLKNIKVIDLSGNILTFFTEQSPFEYTPNIESLLLSYNKIVKFPANVFRNLHYLEIISLTGNIIRPWYHEFLPDSDNQTALLLDENAITHFTLKMFNDLSRVHFVEFSKNPINCSHCSTIELQEWMKNRTSYIPSFNRTGDYTCQTPDTLRGIDIIRANITSATLHCLPHEKDFLTPLYIVLSLIISITLLSIVIWHRWSWNIKYYIFLIQLRTRKYKDLVDSRHFAFDAYVSYCESNLEWIESHLVPALEDGNPKIRLCLPDRNFDAGFPILDNIVTAIDISRSTIIVVSNDYLDSSWCLYNIQMAQNLLLEKRRRGLIIVILEDIKKNKLVKDLQYILRTRTCIWWTENPVGQKLFWERLRITMTRPTDKGISRHIT